MPTLIYNQDGNTFTFALGANGKPFPDAEQEEYRADVRIRNNDPVKSHEAFLLFRDWAKRRRGAYVQKREPRELRFEQDGADIYWREIGTKDIREYHSDIKVGLDLEKAKKARQEFLNWAAGQGFVKMTWIHEKSMDARL